MERSEIDLDGWELLPNDGFFDYKHGERKGGFLASADRLDFDQKCLVDVNYFICPLSPHRPLQLPMNPPGSTDPNSPVSVKFAVEKNQDHELQKEDEKVALVEIKLSPAIMDKLKTPNLADPDAVSQVSFKKIKEPQFVDMKMDSQESNNRGIKPQFGVGSLQFEEKSSEKTPQSVDMKMNSQESDNRGIKAQLGVGSLRFENGEVRKDEELVQSPTTWIIDHKKEENFQDQENKDKSCWEDGGFSIWKWRLTGIGALCSLGAAAATICIIVFGCQRQKQQTQQNQKLKIQIYPEEMRIKDVVQHAGRFNQALSAVRGVPLTRAHITFGGYYHDGL